jgi:DnaJ-class molecular chaperone
VDVIVVRELGGNDFVVRCGYCAGEGRMPLETKEWKVVRFDSNSGSCDVCDGRGVVRVTVADVVISDAGCRGSGLAIPNDTFQVSKCSKCNGVGARSLSGALKIMR